MKQATKRNFYHYYIYGSAMYVAGALTDFYHFTLEGKIVGCNLLLAIAFCGFGAWMFEQIQPKADKYDVLRSVIGALIGVNLACWIAPNMFLALFLALSSGVIIYKEFVK